MKKIIIVLFLITSTFVFSQEADELVNIHSMTEAQMQALTPESGCLAFNTTDKNLYIYNGTEWEMYNKRDRTYVGHFIISSTGNQTITGLPFQPSSITFVAHANVETLDLDSDNGVSDNNTGIANAYGSMNGFARNDNGTITQQVIYVGGSGNSINDISRYSSSSYCVGLRYSNQNGNALGRTLASITSFNTDGFTINISSKADNVVVLYTAYE